MDLNGRGRNRGHGGRTTPLRSARHGVRSGRVWTVWGLLLGLVVLGLGFGALTWKAPREGLYPARGPDRVQVHVVDNGFHTDLVLPRQALAAGAGPLARAVREPGGGDFVYIGWGDARFFVEEGPVQERWRDGLRALFARGNPSVLMVRSGGAPERIYRPDEQVILSLSPEGFHDLVEFIEADMVRRPDGSAVLVGLRARDGTRFYAHRQAFWIGNLCNHWTLEGLSAAGLRTWPWRLMTSGEVMRQSRMAARKAEAVGVDLGVQAP